MFGLGKKKSTQGPQAAGTPFDQVMGLRQQGYPNEQIIQILQGQGYSSAQIFDAMNHADMGGVPGAPQQGYMQPEMQQQQFQPQPQQEAQQYEQPSAYPADDREKMEEIAEAIIDEKWNELLKDINKMTEWNAKTETRLTKIEQDLKNLKDSFDTLHKGILGKISEYDQNLVNVGTEIKAMEKVFEKILPSFTDNVQKLSRITDKVEKGDIEQKLTGIEKKGK